jgi:hypothetical protein
MTTNGIQQTANQQVDNRTGRTPAPRRKRRWKKVLVAIVIFFLLPVLVFVVGSLIYDHYFKVPGPESARKVAPHPIPYGGLWTGTVKSEGPWRNATAVADLPHRMDETAEGTLDIEKERLLLHPTLPTRFDQGTLACSDHGQDVGIYKIEFGGPTSANQIVLKIVVRGRDHEIVLSRPRPATTTATGSP